MDITIRTNNYERATEREIRNTHIALIAAAGKGTRMRTEVPKQLLCYKGKAVVEMCIRDRRNSAWLDDSDIWRTGDWKVDANNSVC